MKLLNREESLKLDHLAYSEYAIPLQSLIDRAARGLLKKMEEIFLFEEKFLVYKNNKLNEIIFLLGPGNNGQDGYYLSKLISEKYPNLKLSIYKFEELTAFNNSPLTLSRVLIIDALFGVGLNREVSSLVKSIIQKVNQKKVHSVVISVDIPTGLDCNSGEGFGAIIKADLTLACEYPKVGCFLNAGPYSSGKIHTVKIGFPSDLLEKIVKEFRLIGNSEARKIFPRKSFKVNKARNGHLLLVAGSTTMPGALRLASEAAARAGVGYITLALDEDWFSDISKLKVLFPDFILLAKTDLLVASELDIKNKYSAILFGPGLSKDPTNSELLKKLLNINHKMLLDAEAFSIIQKNGFQINDSCIVTPHAGELSRLIFKTAEEIERNRIEACRKYYESHKGILLLKGHKTIVCSDNKFYLIASGNKALAKAGTGDVLAGIISSYLAQGLSLEKAAALGAYIHGALADEWIQQGNTVTSLMASDLITGLKKINLLASNLFT